LAFFIVFYYLLHSAHRLAPCTVARIVEPTKTVKVAHSFFDFVIYKIFLFRNLKVSKLALVYVSYRCILHLFPHSSHRNIQLLTVFGNGSSGNGVAAFFEYFGQLVVWQWFVFVFFFDDVF
jgi:hypothetical protein